MNKQMKEIDCSFTEEIVCPYCGHKFTDSWEYDDYADDMYCDDCEKEFSYGRHVEVTYCSYKND